MKKQLSFQFVDTETAAVALCNELNAGQSYYMRKHKPAHYTPWSSQDNTEQKFVVFYWC